MADLQLYIGESRPPRQTAESRPYPRPIPAMLHSLPIHVGGRMPSPRCNQESNDSHGDCTMLKTFAALGISAAIALAPLAAFAQTDTTAPAAGAAAAPAASDAMAPAKDSMKKAKKAKKTASKKAKKAGDAMMAPAAPAAPAQ